MQHPLSNTGEAVAAYDTMGLGDVDWVADRLNQEAISRTDTRKILAALSHKRTLVPPGMFPQSFLTALYTRARLATRDTPSTDGKSSQAHFTAHVKKPKTRFLYDGELCYQLEPILQPT